MSGKWIETLGKVIGIVDVDRLSLLPLTVAVSLLPVIFKVSTSYNHQHTQPDLEEGVALNWQRACTIHMIVCAFYLLDLAFDVVVTGLHNISFVKYNFFFYILGCLSSIMCRIYYKSGIAAAVALQVDGIFTIWFVAVVLLEKCCPAVWTPARRRVGFLLAAMMVLMKGFLYLFHLNIVSILLTGLFLILGVVVFGLNCARTAIVVEASALSDKLTVDEKRSCLLIVCIVMYYSSMVHMFFGVVFDSSDDHLPGSTSMHVDKYTNIAIAVLVSYIPWRVSTRSFIENRRRLDSKLEFISKMSFAIRQRFGVLSGGAENFLHELTESRAESAVDLVSTMKDVMESCSISKSVLDDFSICESIINGETKLAAKETHLFVDLKDILMQFYAAHPYMNLRVFCREPEAALSTLSACMDQSAFRRVVTILLNAAVLEGRAGAVSPPVTVDIKCVLKANGQRVAQDEQPSAGIFERIGDLFSPAQSLFIRVEIRGAGIKRGIFEFFDENSLDKASVFVPAYDKDSGLGFWICREFLRSMGGGIGIVSLEDCEDMDESTPNETPHDEEGREDGDRTSPLRSRDEGECTGEHSPSAGTGTGRPSASASPRSTPGPRSRSNTAVASSDERCCLILDIPVVPNEQMNRFLSSSVLLSPSQTNHAASVASLIAFLSKSQDPSRVLPLDPENQPGDPGEGGTPIDAPPSYDEPPDSRVGIPVEPPSPVQPSSPAQPVLQHELPAMISDLKILVVDDSKLIRNMLCKMLRSRPKLFQLVAEAEEGVRGVDLVKESMDSGVPFDVVLMDYHMPPGINGPVSVEMMRAYGFKGIVIGVTAMNSIATTEAFISHGADRVLLKPVKFDMLYETVRDVQLDRITNLKF